MPETSLQQTEFCDKLVCMICEYASDTSLISHITKRHKMTMNEYRKSYPNSIVQRMSQRQREKMKSTWSSESRKEKLLANRSFPSEIKHWVRKGLTEHEAKTKVAEHQTKLALKQNNQQTKLKQSQNTTGDNNPMSLASIATRYNVSIENARSLTPAFGRSGAKHPLFGKHHTLETRMKIAANSSKKRVNRSKAEDEIAEKLRSLGISLSQNVGIKTFNVDILLDNKMIVEYYGDLWHCNPAKYCGEDYVRMLKMKASNRWELDRKRLEILVDAGYNVIVIWEKDWNENPQQQIKRVIDAANFIF